MKYFNSKINNIIVSFIFFAVFLQADEHKLNVNNFETYLDPEGEIWEMTAQKFMRNTENAFRWLSETKNGARYSAVGHSQRKLTFENIKIWELNVRFKDEKISRIDMSIYNRADSGKIDKKEYVQLVRNIGKILADSTGEKGTDTKKKRIGKDAKLYTRHWAKKPYAYKLKWSFTSDKDSFNGEYIQLEITEFDEDNDPTSLASRFGVAKKKSKSPKRDDVKSHICKKDDGTIYIKDIPMVDQGPKGYCAVATVERILKHYGSTVDQHMIAQMAKSSAAGGTNPEKMYESLEKAASEFRIRVNDIICWEYSDFKKMMRKYNREARREDKTEYDPRRINVPISVLYAQLDKDIFREIKCEKMRSDYRKFKRTIKENIEEGAPIAWSVILGIIPEPEIPQTRGGHMRLIIGYKPQEDDDDEIEEIIYSDSWGKGHEFKTMPVENAWIITTGLYECKPRFSGFAL